MPQTIRIYGSTWCGDCHRSKRLLDKHHIPYEWVDVENDDKAQRFVREANRGMMSVPTIVFEDGIILVEPSDAQLARKVGIR